MNTSLIQLIFIAFISLLLFSDIKTLKKKINTFFKNFNLNRRKKNVKKLSRKKGT